MLAMCCVRDAEGAETNPSFGHPSNVRRGEGGTAFGAERSEAAKATGQALNSNEKNIVKYFDC